MELDAQKKVGKSIQKDLAGDFIYCEAQGDFTLPDYLPEIRKIIRIDSTVIPSGRFIGNGKAELAGSVAYNVIYSDAEGKLCATSLSSDYELSVPIGADCGELSVSVDSIAENTQCRLSGPRKLSLRTAVKSRVHVYTVAPCAQIVDEELYDLQTLECPVRTMLTKCAQPSELSLCETASIDGYTQDSVRANYSTADIVLREARLCPDGVVCRGEAIVKCNISPVDSGEPFTLSKKIPFEQTLSVDTSGMKGCLTYGRCTYLRCSVVPNGERCELAIELGAELWSECVGNSEISMMRDAYSTEYDSHATYKTETFSELVGVSMGNYTLDSSRKLTQEETAIISVIDTKGSIEIKSVTEKDKKAVVSGECKIEALTASKKSDGEGVEYGNSEIIFPFKLETDLRTPDCHIDYEPHASIAMTRARLDADNLCADAEIFLTLKASRKEQYKLLDSIHLDTEEKRARPAAIVTVAYVEDGDTLFSLAKRYGVDYGVLAEENGIPESLAATPDEISTLDGIRHLIIS